MWRERTLVAFTVCSERPSNKLDSPAFVPPPPPLTLASLVQITDMKNFFCPIAGCSNSQQKNLRTDQAMWKKQWEADEDMVYQMEAHEKKKARAELRKKAKAEEESESDDDEEDEEDVEVL